MDQLAEKVKDAGCIYYSLAAKALNTIITLINDHKLTKQQYVMFALADMITYVEVGVSLARKAVGLTDAGDAQAEKTRAMSRIFANETAQLVAGNIIKILLGSGVMDPSAISDFMETISYNKLIFSSQNIIADMDLVADILFERR